MIIKDHFKNIFFFVHNWAAFHHWRFLTRTQPNKDSEGLPEIWAVLLFMICPPSFADTKYSTVKIWSPHLTYLLRAPLRIRQPKDLVRSKFSRHSHSYPVELYFNQTVSNLDWQSNQIELTKRIEERQCNLSLLSLSCVSMSSLMSKFLPVFVTIFKA